MTAPALEHRHLRSALEFAVAITREGVKRRPPLPVPAELKRYTRHDRLPAASLGPVRRVIEADPEFRRVLGIAATPELVDPVGLLWLRTPDGWEAAIADELDRAAAEVAEGERRSELQRERKRREAAETAAARSRAEVAAAVARAERSEVEITALRAEVDQVRRELESARSEAAEARLEARHANDRERAALARVERLTEELGDADQAHGPRATSAARDDHDTDDGAPARDAAHERARDDEYRRLTDELARLRARTTHLADVARDLAQELLRAGEPPAPDTGTTSGTQVDARPDRGRPSRRADRTRRPIKLPGGVTATSALAVDHLLRSGAVVVVDGYNVSMLGWPSQSLEDQRRALLDLLEAVAGRTGAEIVVVFDGADVVGAASDRRRSVRVVYSPAGVTADDVVRDEVRRLPVSRHVVVVSTDGEIVRDVRADGANTVPSEAFLATVR